MEKQIPKVTIVREGPGFGRVMLAFVSGAAMGAVAALLAAPRSGEDTRARLRDYARNQKAKLSHLPEALSAASTAAGQAFHEALDRSSPPPHRH